jgi:putative salt-induced outer membrane protein
MVTTTQHPVSRNKYVTLLTTSLLASSLLATPTLFAADKDKPSDKAASEKASTDWKGELSFGLNSMSGNVDTKSGNVGLNLNRETLPWRYRVAAKADAMDVSNQRISESYLLDLQADYVLPNKNYWFGYAGYDSNKFARIDKRFVEIAGYGTNLLDSPKTKLGVEAGLGARQSTFTEDFGKENEAIGHLGVEYSRQLTDNTKFSESFVIQPGKIDTFTLSDTSLDVGMSKKTSIKLSYGYTNNSKVFPNTKKTDTTSGVSFVMGF